MKIQKSPKKPQKSSKTTKETKKIINAFFASLKKSIQNKKRKERRNSVILAKVENAKAKINAKFYVIDLQITRRCYLLLDSSSNAL